MKRKLSEMGFMPIVGMRADPVVDQFGNRGGLIVTPIVYAKGSKTEINTATGEVTQHEGMMRIPLSIQSVLYTLN